MRRRTFLLGALGLAGRAAASPLGSIAYVQRDGLWMRALPDGKPARLVTGSKVESPRFSPSGQWIAYSDRDRLHVIASGGGPPLDLGKASGQWAPASDELLAGGSKALRIFSAANHFSNPIRILRGAGLPAIFSPGRREIVYADEVERGRGQGGILLRTGFLRRSALSAPSSPVTIRSDPEGSQIPCLWTRDGWIVYWQDPDFSASAQADGLELFRIPEGGGDPQSLGISTLVHDDMIALAPSEDKLAVCCGGGREEWEDKRIAVVDLASWRVSYLTGKETLAVCPAWSPDGRWVAYSAAPVFEIKGCGKACEEAGTQVKRGLAERRIWVIGADGAASPRQLTGDSRYRDEEPLWSKDGGYILFCRMDANDHKSLWLMRADGGGATPIAESLYTDPGLLGVDGTWFGYYGYIDWRSADYATGSMFDWYRG